MSAQPIYDVLDEIAADPAVGERDVLRTLHARGVTAAQLAAEFDDEAEVIAAWRGAVRELAREREEAETAERQARRRQAIWALAERLAVAARAAGYDVRREAAAESSSCYVTLLGADEYALVRVSDHRARRDCARHIDVSLNGCHESATHVVECDEADLDQAASDLLAAAIVIAGPPEHDAA